MTAKISLKNVSVTNGYLLKESLVSRISVVTQYTSLSINMNELEKNRLRDAPIKSSRNHLECICGATDVVAFN